MGRRRERRADPFLRFVSEGARLARWNPNGCEIVFLSAGRRLVSVPVQTAPSLKLGAPTPLFALGDDTRLVDFEISRAGRPSASGPRESRKELSPSPPAR
jgi:hypothetical protein